MECPCGGETCVMDSRPSPHGRILRRRRCMSCNRRFSTYEISADTLAELHAQVDAGLTNQQTLDAVRKLVEPEKEKLNVKDQAAAQ